MKITRRQLKKIIKEEITKTLFEADNTQEILVNAAGNAVEDLRAAVLAIQGFLEESPLGAHATAVGEEDKDYRSLYGQERESFLGNEAFEDAAATIMGMNIITDTGGGDVVSVDLGPADGDGPPSSEVYIKLAGDKGHLMIDQYSFSDYKIKEVNYK